MPSDLVTAIKRRFICRADVKAIQSLDGEYRPALVPGSDYNNPEYEPWSNQDVEDHLADGFLTYGHYLLNQESKCKVLAFDLDLSKLTVSEATQWRDSTVEEKNALQEVFRKTAPYQAWRDRKSPMRDFLKAQMRQAGERIARVMYEELELEVAVAYSGHKGVHVYGFTGPAIDAYDVRMAAYEIVMPKLGDFTVVQGLPGMLRWEQYPIFTVEVFPKQDTLREDGLGNLMRLPLGRNLKAPNDPTFFLDLTAPYNQMRPADPLWALTGGAKNPWKVQGE